MNCRNPALPFQIAITIISFCFFGCAQLERHPESGYAERSHSPQRSSRSKKSSDFSASSKPQVPTSDRVKLQSLESSLTSKKELEQYSKVLPWFKSDQERLDFLRQGSFEDKQRWLNEKNFLSRPQQVSTEMKELVEAQDITIGMPQTLVKKSWGDPDQIEVSGNPQLRNERWRYNRYISTSDGYKAEKKIVYFEGGRVVGWEVE